MEHGLPNIGSFSLIKDLVRDYTDLSNVQTREKRKHDLDSLRAYPGTKIAQDVKLAHDKVAWQDRAAAQNVAKWGSESLGKKNTLFR